METQELGHGVGVFCLCALKFDNSTKNPYSSICSPPYQYGYEFKVILTNKHLSARKVLMFHQGRGAQEGLFAELKSDNQMGYVPTRTWVGNQIYLLSVLLAHNLVRELQMIAHPPSRLTLEKRPALWDFLPTQYAAAPIHPACRPFDTSPWSPDIEHVGQSICARRIVALLARPRLPRLAHLFLQR